MALDAYRKKRDFAKTPEPDGAPEIPSGAAAKAGADERPGTGGLLYVIQKHAARRLHYDLRLELDGVLLSWAVPKGPSLDPKDRRLAARVEDHPLEYGSFEGTIPEGEYGGGTVQLWDRGVWSPEGDPHEGLRQGDLKFTLYGEKLKGSWVLVRMKPRPAEEGKENWLLIKHRDEESVDGDDGVILLQKDRSVASGRTLEEISSAGQSSVWHGDRPVDEQTDVRAGEEFVVDPSGLAGARPTPEMPRFVRPEAATLVDQAPEGDAWLHEVKFDGYRALSRIQHGEVQMYSRNDKEWTAHYKVLAADLARLPVETAMFDGEVVVQMPDGTTSFQALQNALGVDGTGLPRRRGASDSGGGGQKGVGTEPAGVLLYYAFDLLYLNGYELLDVALEDRKELLRRVLSRAPQGGRIQYSEHIAGGGRTFLEQACRHGLEGVVSKKMGSRYRPGARGSEWLKTKCRLEQEFVIGGWTDPGGSRVGFGALLLGAYQDGLLSYVGKVGTGFSEKLLRGLGEKLRSLSTDDSPFEHQEERVPPRSHFVRPELVAQVAFSEWTREGDIRHASFKGLREDKAPVEVVPEAPVAAPPAARRIRTKKQPETQVVNGVALTNPGKLLWLADEVTKRGLVDYYDLVAERMLPYVIGRPVAMVRCPEGVGGNGKEQGSPGKPCFYHKHPGGEFPGPFELVTITESAGPDTYLTITEAGSLTGLAQMGVLEIHVWGSTWPDIEHPDMLVFDLDPDSAVSWKALADGARLVRDVLSALGLESFVKTTGGKGLHVEAPVTPGEDWETVRTFCKAVADAVVAHAPERYTANMAKAKRGGKIYVDYVRNNRGATSIAPYSTRARDRATVAVPLRWTELSGSLRPDTYTTKSLANRLRRLKSDPWEGWTEVKRNQQLTKAMMGALGVV